MPSANRQRFDRLRSLDPMQAISAWLFGEFSIGDEPALMEAIRKDPRVTLTDEAMMDAMATAIDQGLVAADCLDFLIGTPPPGTTTPPTVNRSVVIVRPGQPFISWAAQLPDASDALPSADGEQSVYLLPMIEYAPDPDEVLEEHFETIFDHELWSWHRVRADWPANRTFTMFKEWFAIEIHSLVMDLDAETSLEHDDED